jgi:hypothetical protein
VENRRTGGGKTRRPTLKTRANEAPRRWRNGNSALALGGKSPENPAAGGEKPLESGPKAVEVRLNGGRRKLDVVAA